MANVIKIKKGLDINLKGEAKEVPLQVRKSETYAVCPDDFDGVVPKVVVKVGDRVKAGSALMVDKNHPEVKFVSPVSGEVVAVNRGEKRKVLSIVVKDDGEMAYVEFGKKDVSSMSAPEVKDALLEAGLWPFIRQRPYDIVANPQNEPRDIFISGFDSAPLAPDFNYVLKGEEKNFQTGLDALKKLTSGKVYLGVKNGAAAEALLKAKNVEVVAFEGPHPAGNVSVQINHIAPINKGDIVWVVRPADVLLIGRLFNKGVTDLSRKVVVTGSETTERGYADVLVGASMCSILEGKVLTGEDLRYISGNVLTGKKVGLDGYLGAYATQVTVIPEGDDVHEFLGWAMPRCDQFSTSHTYFSWLRGKNTEYCFDARIKGGKRAMIMSHDYDKVFPMDILPEYLLKAIIAFNIDKMENLGIYEVAPEDFALCEFVDVSKIELQKIVRNGLDMLYKELN
ncbi:MAG: Na(+)-translocating NADH-quinone reductase subunit A [Bacteroidales bacterium]|nr:Na(+)-translocating NADH-quinone reductase subunit A [Bacteroidales bacterium]